MSHYSFKVKPDRIKHKTEITSLDLEHKKFLNELKKKKELKVVKIEKIESIKKKIEYMDKNINKYDNYIEQRTALLLEIDKLTEFIENIDYDESKYFTRSYDVVVSYYDCAKQSCKLSMDSCIIKNNDIIEEKEEIKELQPKSLDTLELLNLSVRKNKKEKKITTKRVSGQKIKSKNILDFLGKNEDSPTSENVEPILNKTTLFKQYKSVLEPTFTKINVNICTQCGSNKLLYQTEGILTCPQCGDSESIFIDIEPNNNHEMMVIKPINPYERKTHFSEWLSNLQIKSSATIPEDVIDLIKLEFKKTQMTQKKINELSYAKYKKILKKLKLQIYYKHISYIKFLITGIRPPTFSREIEDQLKLMFDMTQEPFQEHKGDRINYLSYPYVLFKFCEILKLTEFMQYFSLLKDHSKLRVQDVIFKLICNDLGWEFKPST